jgi:hypothetical protein
MNKPTQLTLVNAQNTPPKKLSHHSYTRNRVRKHITMSRETYEILERYKNEVNNRSYVKDIYKTISYSDIIDYAVASFLDQK